MSFEDEAIGVVRAMGAKIKRLEGVNAALHQEIREMKRGTDARNHTAAETAAHDYHLWLQRRNDWYNRQLQSADEEIVRLNQREQASEGAKLWEITVWIARSGDESRQFYTCPSVLDVRKACEDLEGPIAVYEVSATRTKQTLLFTT